MKRLLAIPMIIGITFVAACSDGQLSKPPPSLSESTPAPVLIKSFKVTDLNAPKTDAGDPKTDEKKPVSIESGGTVMVSWEVIGASKVEITDSKGKHLANASGLVGATPSDPLMADETFTLTAEGSDGVKAQETATVSVRKKEIKITSFKADPDKINAGEETKLCWTITDSTAKVSVKAGDVEIYPGNAVPETTPAEQPLTTAEGQPSDVSVTTVSKAMRFLLKGSDTPVAPPADSYATTTEPPKTDAPVADAVEVCPVTDKPTKTTTYTLSVMDGDKVAATQDAIVTVASAPAVIAAFVAQPAQLSGPGEVTLTWRASPSDVTVSIDHGVTTNDKSEGEKTVHVTDTTTFTLTATTKDGQSKTQTVTVTLPSAADRKVVAKTLTSSIFAGETAKIAITHGNVSGTVSVLDGLGRAPAFTMDGTVLSIKDAPVGSSSYIIDIDGERSNPVSVEVRSVVKRSSTGTYGVAFAGARNVVAGSDNGGVEEKKEGDATKYLLNIGMVSVLDMESVGENKVDIASGISKLINPDFTAKQYDNFGPYPVRTIVADVANPVRLFAGTTGALLVSKNAGQSWSVVDPLGIFDNKHQFENNNETHPGCFGSVQKGIRYAKANGGLVSFSQVCDIYVDGKFVVLATDQGTYHINNIDGRLDAATKKNNPWKVGMKGRVVNSLASSNLGDSTLIVAGASDGIYVYTKGKDAASWQQIDKAGMKSAVNTVAISGNTIYVGTDKGLFKSNGLDASSTFTQVTISTDPVAVKALAVDAADSATIYVGTAKSLKISRDCAGSFADVTVDVGEVRNIATSADSGRSAIVLTSKNGLFTSVGVAGEAGTCAASTPAPQPTTGGTTTGDSRPSSPTSGPGTVVPK